jgi:hypothetical protein
MRSGVALNVGTAARLACRAAGVWRGAFDTVRTRLWSIERRFTDIYRHRGFGVAHSASGPGSDLAQTQSIRDKLPGLLRELGVRTLLDIPCGDYHWMRQVPLRLERYIGADIVRPLVASNDFRYADAAHQFVPLDLTRDALPAAADLILCRDCLVHLSLRDATRAIRQIRRSGARYLLTTTFPATCVNTDIITAASWRPVNLQLSPFGLPEPLRLLSEGCTEARGRYSDKSLGLWRIPDLPQDR